MTPSLIIALATFAVCLLAAGRSLRQGLCAVITVGYLYGITRANFPDLGTYLMFDLAVAALYLVELRRPLTYDERRRTSELRLWMTGLIAWPILLFVLSPTSSPAVELVGLRANILMLPFLLIGAKLGSDELKSVALYIAGLNIAAGALGGAEFLLGVERFFPQNETTEIIYKSRDVAGYSAYRIPASFINAHAYAGTMVMTLPLLVGAWAQRHDRRWENALLAAAIIASFMGIFMAATRTHMVTAALLAAVVTLTGRFSTRQWMRWVVAVAIIGYVVAGDVRFQRFTTLADRSMVSTRIHNSFNEDFFEVISEHPLGRGLASGGTSVPYFLRDQVTGGALLENEYARLGLELGLPGLTLWVLFIAWVLSRRPGRVRDTWLLARRMAWVAAATMFASGMVGMGMMASVPQTAIMLLSIGWMTTARRAVTVTEAAATPPAAAPLRRLRAARGLR
jgi:hypothetical protein